MMRQLNTDNMDLNHFSIRKRNKIQYMSSKGLIITSYELYDKAGKLVILYVKPLCLLLVIPSLIFKHKLIFFGTKEHTDLLDRLNQENGSKKGI